MLLLDVSGSMSDWSRALVLFAHAAVRANRSWEAFCFGTRLTRLTRALRTPRPDEALRRAAEAAPDRDAGTRIGESLKAFLDDHGRRGLARGAVVVIASDGLELGDPALLAEQAERLARLAHRVVWLNPLKGDPAYEPLTRGMRAALPYVDELASGHNLASLEALGDLLGWSTSARSAAADSFAIAVNDARQVVGNIQHRRRREPCVLVDADRRDGRPRHARRHLSTAVAVNDDGQVVGYEHARPQRRAPRVLVDAGRRDGRPRHARRHATAGRRR